MKNSMRWLLVCMLLISALPAQTASAARGVPGSPDLGYGAWLHLNGQNLEHAKSLLADLKLTGLQWSQTPTLPLIPQLLTGLSWIVLLVEPPSC